METGCLKSHLGTKKKNDVEFQGTMHFNLFFGKLLFEILIFFYFLIQFFIFWDHCKLTYSCKIIQRDSICSYLFFSSGNIFETILQCSITLMLSRCLFPSPQRPLMLAFIFTLIYLLFSTTTEVLETSILFPHFYNFAISVILHRWKHTVYNLLPNSLEILPGVVYINSSLFFIAK
jgi:hypothetical protein